MIPDWGVYRRQPVDLSLTLMFLSLPAPASFSLPPSLPLPFSLKSVNISLGEDSKKIFFNVVLLNFIPERFYSLTLPPVTHILTSVRYCHFLIFAKFMDKKNSYFNVHFCDD